MLRRVRRLRATPTWLALAVLVSLSTLLRFWAARGVPSPWITPDEVIYGELGRSLYSAGHFELLGQPIGFYGLVYPVLVGLPLRLGDPELGYTLLKALQALVMSLAAVPVFLWGRTFMARGFALAAAALSLAIPGLAYSGLIMTEVAFYPVLLLAAWAMARALACPTLGRQALLLGALALAVTTRLQALVLAPALVTALALQLLLDRRLSGLRRFTPTLAGLALLAAFWSAWQLRHGGPATQLLGAYRGAGEISYDAGQAARFILYHAGDLVLFTGVLPACAVALLVVGALCAGERSPEVRAYLAVTVAFSAWFTAEVGVFASRHVGRLAERDLLALAPLLFLGFGLWLDRGAPRPRAATLLVGVSAFLLVLNLPIRTFVSLAAIPDAFTLIPLWRVQVHWPGANLDVLVEAVAAVAIAVFAVVARRLAWALPLALLVVFAGASVSASRVVEARSTILKGVTLASERRWIDRRASRDVAYLYAGEVYWNAVWLNAFWNRRLNRVYDLFSARVPGPIPQQSVGPLFDGRLVLADGAVAPARYVVASHVFGFVGRPLASAPQADLTLWELRPPLRLALWVEGVDGTGFTGYQAKVNVFACRPGRLRLELGAPGRRTVELLRNGRPYRTLQLEGGLWRGLIPTRPPLPVGHGLCTFGIRARGGIVVDGAELVRVVG